MCLDEFVKKYENKKVDFDGVYGAQCVDLFRQYVKECLGIKNDTPEADGGVVDSANTGNGVALRDYSSFLD